MQGGQYEVGTVIKPADDIPPAAPVTTTETGVGFTPHGLLFASFNVGAATSQQEHGRISFSATDISSGNQRASFFHGVLGSDTPTEIWQGTSTTKVIHLAQADCSQTGCTVYNTPTCSGSAQVISEADVTSFDSDGFDLQWTTNETSCGPVNRTTFENSAEILYVAFGNETTEVKLTSFTAAGYDGGMLLEWETASELNNLGFHLYRATSAEGPYQRITSGAIPGLGSSPEGARYSYKDSGLENGKTYYYKLEDIETTGKTELHGPVSATPGAGATEEEASGAEGGAEPEELPEETARIEVGNPSATGWRVLKQGRRQVILELNTKGFYAIPQEDGTVRLSIPGFVETAEAGLPSVPVKRAWVKAVAGRDVRIASVRPSNVVAFSSLRPSAAETPEVIADQSGVVQAGRRRQRWLREALP